MKDWSLYRDYGVYLVTDHDLCLGRPILDVVLQAVEGGVGAVQIREKTGKTRDFLELAKLLVREVQSKGVPVIINDRVDIALASGAAGVHVGQSDMPVKDARLLLGEKAIIGLTAPTMEGLAQGIKESIQYIAVSPVFATMTKTDTAPAWGLEGMREARAFMNSVSCDIPLMTIGGVGQSNARAIRETGIESIAVVSAICSADSPCEATRAILKEWNSVS